MAVNPRDIDARITELETAYGKALASVTTGVLWQSSDDRHAEAVLRNMRSTMLDPWSQRGHEAAFASPQREPLNSDGKPSSWKGWTAYGRTLLAGFPDIVKASVTDYSISDVVETSTQAAASAGKKVASAAKSVAGAVGSTAASALWPLVLPLAIGLVAFVVVRGTVTR